MTIFYYFDRNILVKRLAFCLFSLFFVGCLQAQTPNRVTYMAEYYYQSALYNPAFAGDPSQPNVLFSGRIDQQKSFSGDAMRPHTLNAMLQTHAERFKSGVGFAISYHNYDETYYSALYNAYYPSKKRQLKIGLLHNYRIEFSEGISLRVGAQAALFHFRAIDPAVYINPGNPQSVVPLNERTFKFNLDLGALFRLDKYYLGIAVLHANQQQFQFLQPGTIYYFRQMLNLQTGYRFGFNYDLWHLEPSITILAQTSPWSGDRFALMDFGVIADYDERFFLGAAYRINDIPDYFLSLKAGIRFRETTHWSFAYHLARNNNGSASTSVLPLRFETTIAFFMKKNAETDEQ